MPELMGIKNVMVLNDEAHHCYREKPGESGGGSTHEEKIKKKLRKNTEAARLWISGLEIVGINDSALTE